MRPGTSKPSDATLSARSLPVSSKLTKTPGSSKRVAPFTRKIMLSSVLPQPGPPQISVGRPAGRPPSRMSSRPSIPVGALLNCDRPCSIFLGRSASLPRIAITLSPPAIFLIQGRVYRSKGNGETLYRRLITLSGERIRRKSRVDRDIIERSVAASISRSTSRRGAQRAAQIRARPQPPRKMDFPAPRRPAGVAAEPRYPAGVRLVTKETASHGATTGAPSDATLDADASARRERPRPGITPRLDRDRADGSEARGRAAGRRGLAVRAEMGRVPLSRRPRRRSDRSP